MRQQKSPCFLILLSSITYANKAQALLRKNGVSSTIIRTPKSYGKTGCSYCLRLNRGIQQAKDLLNRGNIPVLGIYPCEE